MTSGISDSTSSVSTSSDGAGKKRKPSLTRAERQKKIKAIQASIESQKRELGLRAPASRRGPVFYLAIMVVLAAIGLSVISASDNPGSGAKGMSGRERLARKSLDAAAEALGRFKFHTGVYPTLEEGGLEALAARSSNRPGWVGPYVHKRFHMDPLPPDPWKHPYVYDPEGGTNGFPVLLSCGPDGKRGTPDDILADTNLFTKPFRDTTWTNTWVPCERRGIIIVPSKKGK